MRKLFALLAVGLLAVAVPMGAIAASVTVSGNLGPSDPVMPVVFINPPDCTGQGTTLVFYEAYPFTVDVSGSYNVIGSSDAGIMSFYLFSPSFDPINGFPTCIAGSNLEPPTVDEPLVAGVQYYAVPFDDSFDQAGGNYTLTISGPGNILISGLANYVAVPTLSPWGGTLLAGALTLMALVWMRRRRRA